MALTEEGRSFYAHALRVIEALDEADASVTPDCQLPHGTLRVNCVPAFATEQLAPLMPEFFSRYPDIVIEFVLGVEQSNLVDSNVDVAIHSGYVQDSSMVMRTIATSRWIICGSPAYLARHGVPVRPEDLADHNCLVQPVDSPWNRWLLSIDGRTEQIDVKGSVVANHASMLLRLAVAGLGLARIAEFFVAGAIERGEVCPVLEEFSSVQEQPIVVIYQNRRNLSPRIKIFLDFLEEKFRSRPWFRAHSNART